MHVPAESPDHRSPLTPLHTRPAQHDVYALAHHLARRFRARYVVDVGCLRPKALTALSRDVEVIGVTLGAAVPPSRPGAPFTRVIPLDLATVGGLPLPHGIVSEAIVVCTDTIGRAAHADRLLDVLGSAASVARAVIVSAPRRDAARRPDAAPPGGDADGWSLDDLRARCEQRGLPVLFAGLAVGDDPDLRRNTVLLILDKSAGSLHQPAPADFRMLSIITAYNEADIIEQVVRSTLSEGSAVWVDDNWSSDGTFEILKSLGPALAGLERFPPDGPADQFQLHAQLRRKEEIAARFPGAWIVNQDADELRCSPWPGVRLRDALAFVDRCGFNCVDFTVLDFRPTDDAFDGTQDLEACVPLFEFGRRPGHFEQQRAWRQPRTPVNLADSGGHVVEFDGKAVYPYKFLLKHYPIRSQRQAEAKVFRDRKPRFAEEQSRRGWHGQYEGLEPGARFLWSPTTLLEYRPGAFESTYLVERLSGIGAQRVMEQLEYDNAPPGLQARVDALTRELAECGQKLASLEAHPYVRLGRWVQRLLHRLRPWP